MKRPDRLKTMAALLGSVMIPMMTVPALARAGESALSVSVTPYKAFAPATVQAFVRVARDPRNRLLRVTLDSGSFYRSSDLPLEGDHAPTAHWVRWPSLPPGSYVVTLELFRSDGNRQIVEDSRLEILGY
jgi:hypothetical protein